MAEKRKRKKTSRTSEDRERYEKVTRLLERRLEHGFAELDRRSGKPVRPWRESADERIADLYRELDRRSQADTA